MSESETAVRFAEKPGDGGGVLPDARMRRAGGAASLRAGYFDRRGRSGREGRAGARAPAATGGSVRSGPLGFDRSRLDGKIGSRCGDLAIVASERAVLVVPRGQTQRVGEAVAALEARRNGGSDNG